MAEGVFGNVRVSWQTIRSYSPAMVEYIFSLINLGYDWDTIVAYYFFRFIGVKRVEKANSGKDFSVPGFLKKPESETAYLLHLKNGNTIKMTAYRLVTSTFFRETKRNLSTIPDEGFCLPDLCGSYDARYSATLLDMPLKEWVDASNYVLAYSQTGDSEHLDNLTSILYKPVYRLRIILQEKRAIARVASLWWWLSAQNGICRRFDKVFKKQKPQPLPEVLDEDGNVIPPLDANSAKRQVRAQISAINNMLSVLTGGDILKEDAVMELPIERCFQKLQIEQQKLEQQWKKKP